MQANGDMTIHTISDRQLLALIEDLGAQATTVDIAARLGRARKNTGSRLGAMRRMGFIEPYARSDGEAVWMLTEFGADLRNGVLKAQLQRQLHDLADDGSLYALTSVIAGRIAGSGGGLVRAPRRELRHHGAIR